MDVPFQKQILNILIVLCNSEDQILALVPGIPGLNLGVPDKPESSRNPHFLK